MKPFMNKRSIFWLIGMALLVIGVLVVLILPTQTPVKGLDEPSVNVPNMENVPSENAPNLKLETE